MKKANFFLLGKYNSMIESKVSLNYYKKLNKLIKKIYILNNIVNKLTIYCEIIKQFIKSHNLKKSPLVVFFFLIVLHFSGCQKI